MDLLTGLGLAIPAGLNAYIPLLVVAAAERLGWIELAEPYSLLGEWWAIVLITVLLIIEIVADKVPAVDTVNDAIQTFVRPAAGGLLVAATAAGSGRINPIVAIVAGVIVAGGVHAAKATTRPVVNVATGGAGAPVASTLEDAVAFAMSVLAIVVPVLVFVSVIALVALIVWRRSKVRRASGP